MRYLAASSLSLADDFRLAATIFAITPLPFDALLMMLDYDMRRFRCFHAAVTLLTLPPHDILCRY